MSDESPESAQEQLDSAEDVPPLVRLKEGLKPDPVESEKVSAEWPPIDPEEIGPLELSVLIGRWISKNAVRLFVAGVVVAIVAGYGVENGWWSLEIPTWVWVFVGATLAAIVLGTYPIMRALRWLWTDRSHALVDIDPVDGDIAVYELSDDRFANLTVIGRDGDEKPSPTAALHEVRLASGSTGYEVESYDPATNTAVASWMAGASNWEIRRHQRTVDVVVEELSAEASRSLDEIIEAPEAVRRQGSTVVNELVRIAEGERAPGEASVSEELSKIVGDQHSKTEELISDRGIDDLESRLEELEQRTGPSQNGGSES
jgi:polyhydroxyalkanoate synthesis regulator phasin